MSASVIPFRTDRKKSRASRSADQIDMIATLRNAKQVGHETGRGGTVFWQGEPIARVEVFDLGEDFGEAGRTVVVHLTATGKSLLPLPWNV